MIHKIAPTSNKPKKVLQILPCMIDYTGEAKVDKFFNSRI